MRRPSGETLVDWITDPFARATGPGQMAAVDVPAKGGLPTPFDWHDAKFAVPPLDDLT